MLTIAGAIRRAARGSAMDRKLREARNHLAVIRVVLEVLQEEARSAEQRPLIDVALRRVEALTALLAELSSGAGRPRRRRRKQVV